MGCGCGDVFSVPETEECFWSDMALRWAAYEDPSCVVSGEIVGAEMVVFLLEGVGNG